ncbi:hypothetical protein M758_1G125600 [Ceratodon purpureus]|uniref:Pentatricopeptide repeat-containing protein-mitochondrial domain-containing protein n=1 Tax=Ceratodon purpureus TaxID=3225 RepID=A0A8T0J4J8_CERPU|nr:hypothetical protein KC19_1G129900 [Ceratodon purpureus]KAG0629732.1 hypothetical protein M758_1G125600 [Ceratodon purpureus]
MYKSLRSVPFRRSLSASKGLLTSQPVASRAEDVYNSQDFTKLGQGITENGLGLAESGVQRIDNLTRRVSRDIKLGRDEVATRLLPQMGSQDRPATVIYCNYLLNSCARARNLNMAKEVYRFMERNGLRMNEISYGCFLRTLCRTGQLDEALELLDVLSRSKGVKANLIMYNTVLNGCSLAKSKVHADKCLAVMERQGIAKDEMSYVELIKLSGLLHDASAVKFWWEELIKKGQPSPSSRCTTIVALCRSRALPEALTALTEMSNILSANDSFHRLPGKKSRPPRSEIESDMREGFELSSEGQHTGVRVRDPAESQALTGFHHWEVRKELQDAFNALINAAGQAGQHKLAESLFSEMRNLGLRLSIYTFNALLRAVVEGRGISHAIRVVRSMEAVGVSPDTHTFTTLLDGYCRNGQLDKAEALLAKMEDSKPNQRPSIYTYNIFIKACASKNEVERALRVFSRMKESGTTPDSHTYCALLAACGTVSGRPDLADAWSRKEVAQRVIAIEKDMAKSGVHHTAASVSALMNLLGSEGMVDAVLQNLRACQETDLSATEKLLDVTAYNTAINACVQGKKFDEAWDIFTEMRSLKVRPDLFTYNILINACAHKQSVETALELMDIMRKDEIAPDLVTYNSLIKVICHCGELDSCLSILKEMKEGGVQPDVATFNTLLASASYHKRKELAEYLVEEMRIAKIVPDTHTCSQVVSLYMRSGDLAEASQALTVLSSRMFKPVGSQQEVDDEVDDADIYDENSDEALEEALLSPEPEAQAVYTSTLAQMIQGPLDASEAENSPWATRLREQYILWNRAPRKATQSR